MTSYYNITYSVEKPIENYITDHWVKSEETNFFKKQVAARCGYFFLAPWSAITSIADTILGSGAGVASIVTGGTHHATFMFAMQHLESSRKVVVRPYMNFLKTLNPESTISISKTSLTTGEKSGLRLDDIKDAFISGEGDGFITHYTSTILKNFARSCYNSDNFFKRHIVSRITYVLLAISSLVTRIVDGIIGVIAAIFSFLTFGKVESINNLAYRALQAPGLVKDLLYCTIKLINPWAGVVKK